jgi:hypothetical protein
MLNSSLVCSACEYETNGTKRSNVFYNKLIVNALKNKSEQSETTYKSGNLAVNAKQLFDYQCNYKTANFCSGSGAKINRLLKRLNNQ